MKYAVRCASRSLIRVHPTDVCPERRESVQRGGHSMGLSMSCLCEQSHVRWPRPQRLAGRAHDGLPSRVEPRPQTGTSRMIATARENRGKRKTAPGWGASIVRLGSAPSPVKSPPWRTMRRTSSDRCPRARHLQHSTQTTRRQLLLPRRSPFQSLGQSPQRQSLRHLHPHQRLHHQWRA